MPKKLLFNFNREVIQNYTYVKYVGTIITATNTLEKPIKSAILKGSTKYRDIDTGEILETFEEGRNLELVSVKMPVLTTYNQENLFKNYIQDGSEWGKDYRCTTTDVKYNQNGGYVKIIGGSSLCYSGFVSPSLSQGTYKFSCKVKVGQVGDSYRILVHNNPNMPANNANGFASDKITSTKEIETFEYVWYFSKANIMLFYTYYKGQEIEYYDIMLTKISDDNVVKDYKVNPQKYEYKTNILTVNEEVDLRGIEDTKDTLDCSTGELIQRVKKIVLNDSLNWILNDPQLKNTVDFYVAVEDKKSLKYETTIPKVSWRTDSAGIVIDTYYHKNLAIRVEKSRLSSSTVEGFKEYIKQNPITVLYELATESIKTVDLSILDQNENKVSSISSFNDTTHIMASSETIPPIFEGYLATKEVE